MKIIDKVAMQSKEIRNEIYNDVIDEFKIIDGSKIQTYRIIDFLIKNYLFECTIIKKALTEILEEDLLYKNKTYRIAMLEISKRILDVRWNLNVEEKDFLFFLVRITYTYPGCVGTPVEIFKLKENHKQNLDILKLQSLAGSDGFCTEYMISQMKGGLSLDILIGCPMGCRYCYRIDGDNMENYIHKWNPEIKIKPKDIVRRLLEHPWFTPHISAVGIHMSTTEAFLEQIWPYTIEILRLLDEKGLTNRISIITKYTVDDEKINELGRLNNISLDICVCYSGMPYCLEPSSDKKRTFFLKKLVEAEKKYPNLYAIAYYRPIIEGYNTSKEKIRETVRLLKKTGVKVVVFGGLKYTDLHDTYFMEMALPRPKGDYEEGKKYLSNHTVDTIVSVFKEEYDKNIPAILRRSSCARVVARGSWYPDYNAHWTVPTKNCSLNCPQKSICEMQIVPNNNTIENLLERIGKTDLCYSVGRYLIIWGTLTIFEKTFLMQNLYYSVLDTNDLLKLVQKDEKEEFVDIIIDNIERFNVKELKKVITFHEIKRYAEILAAVKGCNNVSNEILYEIEWEETTLLLQCNKEYIYEGIQLSLATILEILNSYVEKKNNLFECLMEEEGINLIHFLVNKFISSNEVSLFSKFNMDVYYKFGISYYKRKVKNSDIQMIGYTMLIKTLESKYKILSIEKSLNVGLIIPMKNERKNILESKYKLKGYDFIKAKVAQITWLFKDKKNINYDIWFIDDNSSDGTGEIVTQILNELDINNCKFVDFNKIVQLSKTTQNADNPILTDTNNYHEWAKGAAVCWGMYEMRRLNKDLIIYTDLDLTYPLEQCGNLIYECMKFNVVATVGSRKVFDSWGYYGKSGPNETSRTYMKAIKEVYKIKEVKDVQAGFKCFRGAFVEEIIEKAKDRKLSFDAELIALYQDKGEVREIGVASYHQYIEGKEGTPRNYDIMLRNSVQFSKQHEILLDINDAPFTKNILELGGLYPKNDLK